MIVPKPPTMDGPEALEKASQFLTEEWAKLKPEDVEVTRLR